jgi:hypothetical protein
MSLFGNLTAGHITKGIQAQIDVFKEELSEDKDNEKLKWLIRGLEMAKDISQEYEY